MPRNVRQKHPSKPARAPKRRDSVSSSSLGLSDDSGYSGVEDLSDSEDDDEDHVFAAEEEHIITNARRKRASDPPRSLVVDDEDDDADEESEADNDVDEEDEDDDEDDDEAEAEDLDVVGDAASWAGFSSDNDDLIPTEPVSLDLMNQVSVTPSRHVRFIGVPDSDSDSTTSETSEIDDIHDFFPDIFVEQSSLDPRFRREIEDDDDISSNGSFWDFHNGSQDIAGRQVGVDNDDAVQDQDATPIATPRHSQPPADMSAPVAVAVEVQELDGYESECFDFACQKSLLLVLILLRQRTVTPRRRTSPSPSSARSTCAAPTRWSRHPTRIRKSPFNLGQAGLALAGSTLIGLTTSPSVLLTLLPAR